MHEHSMLFDIHHRIERDRRYMSLIVINDMMQKKKEIMKKCVLMKCFHFELSK